MEWNDWNVLSAQKRKCGDTRGRDNATGSSQNFKLSLRSDPPTITTTLPRHAPSPSPDILTCLQKAI